VKNHGLLHIHLKSSNAGMQSNSSKTGSFFLSSASRAPATRKAKSVKLRPLQAVVFFFLHTPASMLAMSE
jgi:hypothetical protein